VADLAAAWSSSNDAQAAMAGALVEGPGLIVIAGTGSVCYGRAADGRESLLGGWGPLAGDEGSGYAIGQAALRHLTQVLDHRLPHDLLSATLMAHLEARDRRTLLDWLYDPPLPRDAVATLSSQVAWASERGDRAARGLLAQAAADLAEVAAALAGYLNLRDAGPRVATLGGVFAIGAMVLTPFRQRLRKRVPGAQIVPARFPPVAGALLLAYRHAGVPLDERMLARLEQTAHRAGLYQGDPDVGGRVPSAASTRLGTAARAKQGSTASTSQP
jgi:N-acetylglucosamine kinase-like BadF-type ATPase